MKELFPHMLLEEELAIPALKLLPALASGKLDPDLKQVLRRTERLKAAAPTCTVLECERQADAWRVTATGCLESLPSSSPASLRRRGPPRDIPLAEGRWR